MLSVTAASLPQREVTIPTYQGKFFLGALREMQRDQIAFFTKLSHLGDLTRVRFGAAWYVLVAHPRYIRHILVDKIRNYPKARWGYDHLKKILGLGLVTSEGDLWRRQRRIAQPGFHHERLTGFATTMTRAAEDMLTAWRAAPPGTVLDVTHDMSQLTQRVVGETLLSRDTSGQADEIGQALGSALLYVNDRTMHPFRPPSWMPTPSNLRFRRDCKVLNRVVRDTIETRRKSGGGDDLLQMLLDARDPDTGEGMSDTQLRDEVMTIFLAGHETTAMALSWTWHLLGLNPQVETQLRAELDSVLGGRTPTLGDLPKLQLTDRVIKESMRIYPPVWFLSRDVVEPDQLGDLRVEPGMTLVVSPYVTHRLPELWPEPERFDPDRFLPGREPADKLAYMPFSAGQRKCLGDSFAMMEARLILATMLQKARLRHVPDAEVEIEALVTLRPKGLRMTVEFPPAGG